MAQTLGYVDKAVENKTTPKKHKGRILTNCSETTSKTFECSP